MNNYIQDKLIEFSNALDTHVLHTQTFFDHSFLTMLETVWGFSCTAISCYDETCEYEGGLAHNISTATQYEYYNEFYKRDPLSKYISNNIDRLTSNDFRVVRSSDIIDNYFESEYFRFLDNSAGMRYSAVIIFDNIRITIYRTDAQGDFTDSDLAFLNSLSRLIWSRYNLFCKMIMPEHRVSLEEWKNRYFDTISTGIIVADHNYNVIESNRIGKEYIKRLSGEASPKYYLTNLITILNLSSTGPSDESQRILKLDDFVISINRYTENSYPIYCIVITHSESEYNNPGSVDGREINVNIDFAKKYQLSDREMEVILALSNGKTYQEIADDLFISINTVRTHVKNIYKKLGINNQRNLLYIYNQFLRSY